MGRNRRIPFLIPCSFWNHYALHLHRSFRYETSRCATQFPWIRHRTYLLSLADPDVFKRILDLRDVKPSRYFVGK